MDLAVPPDADPVDNGAEVEFEPFAMADLPSAYWVGRASAAGMALGGTACHMLFEFEKEEYDVPRLERALQLVVNRHKMLRCVVTDDGMNQVLRSVPPYAIRVVDKSALSEEEFEAWRDAEWRAMLHRVFDASEWPLFDVQVVKGRNSQWLLTDFDRCAGGGGGWLWLRLTNPQPAFSPTHQPHPTSNPPAQPLLRLPARR